MIGIELALPSELGLKITLPGDVHGMGPGLRIEGDPVEVMGLLRALYTAAHHAAEMEETGEEVFVHVHGDRVVEEDAHDHHRIN